ncbi:MAG: DUF664 domain-containing protein, partial [Gemmatimonadetes bacterium]|nr:DUF664 domain-containing protein [Gemmatimonadota bacterium]NIV56718.1 DUF664 domain-containing protein [Actinomycetota bacterium]NIW38282.1 DUF664 domain-containing protein [Gemmatimonadota bacterium]NIY13093.1 DUF664 domain-containing protein [Gemmatimonadota bacterium]
MSEPVGGAAALAALLRLNTRLFHACLEGVTAEEAEWRPVDGANGLGFIALHVVDARYFMAGVLGRPLQDPFPEYADTASIAEVESLPALSELRAAWDEVSPAVVAGMAELPPERAASSSSGDFPVDDPSVLGAAAFLVQHESYHIGQLSLLRRQLGHPP